LNVDEWWKSLRSVNNINSKFQITNNKWFDKLTTLSQVEGQIPMTEIQNPKPVYVLVIDYCNLMLVIWDLNIVHL